MHHVLSSPESHNLLRQLPGVERLLQDETTQALIAEYGRSLTTEALRNVLQISRQELSGGSLSTVPTSAELLRSAAEWISASLQPTLQPVINASGIIIHTNLGRAPLSRAARDAVSRIGAGYSTLEYDLDEGKRGSRTMHAENLLTQLTGAEAALVVNNNAAAILLMLSALCRDREVIISRGQLVEIGGGFRIPDVLAQSGARLVEVGTTNRTHLRDYASAINENTAAILVVHASNYRIVGFTSQPEMSELATLASESGIALLFDEGSGAMVDLSPYGIEPEVTVSDGLRAGCYVVAFSGDKLLGGPQAGILCGASAHIDTMKHHPLARAVRADKLCLAALNATLRHYLAGEAMSEVPVLHMIALPADDIRQTAEQWQSHLQARLQRDGLSLSIVPGESRVGGGSLPGTTLPTHLLAIEDDDLGPNALADRLRRQTIPVIGRIQDGRYLLDPRTVSADHQELLLQALWEELRPD